jgi:hypothetical protein
MLACKRHKTFGTSALETHWSYFDGQRNKSVEAIHYIHDGFWFLGEMRILSHKPVHVNHHALVLLPDWIHHFAQLLQSLESFVFEIRNEIL